jgi:predicted permease
MPTRPLPSVVRRVSVLVASAYARTGISYDDAAAFLSSALDDAWDRRRWRGVAALAVELAPDLMRTTFGRAALPVTRSPRFRRTGIPEPVLRASHPSDPARTEWGSWGPASERVGGRAGAAPPALITRSHTMDRLLADIRTAGRGLLRTPAFTGIACLTLALGVGASTAVFAVVDGAILRPFSYPDMERIVLLTEQNRPSGQEMSVSYPNFVDWRAAQDVLSELGIYRGVTLNLADTEMPQRLNGSLVSASIFETTGLTPVRGRTFTAADDAPTVGRIAIISERLWESLFGREDRVIGAALRLNDEAYSIVGVMPAGMRFPSRTTDVWLPVGLYVNTFPMDRGNHPGLTAVGRLKPGVALESARTAFETIATNLETRYPDSNRGNTIIVRSYHEAVVSYVRPAMQLLLGAVGLLLLIACANLASLLLARSESRRQELSIRAALGAGRGRLARQLLLESLVVAAVGGAIGVLLAHLAVQAFVATRPTIIPRIDLIAVDWRVIGFGAVLSLATVILFGVFPALRAASPDLQSALRDVRTSSAAKGAMRARRILVSAQVAVATVLVIAAVLFGRSLARLQAIDPGFEPTRVVTMRVALSDARYPSQAAWSVFFDRLVAELGTVPAVQAIGINSAIPMEGGGSESPVIKEEDPPPSPDRQPPICLFQTTGGEYFRAMSIPLRRGRTFDARDRTGSTPVIIVDDSLVARMFPDRDPIGQRIAFENAGSGHQDHRPIWREIIGVVGTVRHYGLLANRPFLQVYVPHTQPVYWQRNRRPAMAIVARTSVEPEAVVASVRQAVSRVDSTLPVYGVAPLADYLRSETEQPRLAGGLIGVFAGVALALAVIGLYGLLAYTVSLRTREIGLRMALGAKRPAILRQVLSQAMALTALGLAAGVGLAIAAAGWLRSQLHEVSPTDVATYVLVAAAFVVVTALASLIPARRAASVDPVIALRGEQ